MNTDTTHTTLETRLFRVNSVCEPKRLTKLTAMFSNCWNCFRNFPGKPYRITQNIHVLDRNGHLSQLKKKVTLAVGEVETCELALKWKGGFGKCFFLKGAA